MIWVKHKVNDMPGTQGCDYILYESAVGSSNPVYTFRVKGNKESFLSFCPLSFLADEVTG